MFYEFTGMNFVHYLMECKREISQLGENNGEDTRFGDSRPDRLGKNGFGGGACEKV